MSNTASSPDDPTPGSVNFLRTPMEPWKRWSAVFAIIGTCIVGSNTLVRCGAEQFKAASDSGARQATEVARLTNVEHRVEVTEAVNEIQSTNINELKAADSLSIQDRETTKRNLTDSTRALTETVRQHREEVNRTLDKVADKIDKIAERVGVPSNPK